MVWCVLAYAMFQKPRSAKRRRQPYAMRWMYMHYEGGSVRQFRRPIFVLFRLIPGASGWFKLICQKFCDFKRIQVDRLGGRFVCHAGEAKGTFVQNWSHHLCMTFPKRNWVDSLHPVWYGAEHLFTRRPLSFLSLLIKWFRTAFSASLPP